ncbi:MAG: hypothetical protein WD766_07030 [Gemmatimonadota bacterium]
MSQNLPERPDAALPPERVLSNQDFEMVIRRAAELQAREAEAKDGEGMSEAEVVRIGRELGLSTRHLNQALAEVGGVPGQESGALVKLYGPVQVSASRTVVGETAEVSRRLERYLVEREYLAVLRRLPDRVVLTRATGVAAAFGRGVSQVFSRSPLLKVSGLEMAVHALEEGYSYVTLSTSLRGNRLATAAGSMLGGGSTAAATGAVLGIAIAPPAALLGLPVLGGAIAIGHFYYKGLVQETQIQLESLLDRLEHGELPPPVTRWSAPRR